MSVNAKQSISGAVISGGNLRGAVGTGTVDVYSYYTPNVTQPDENTMQVEYVPSSKNMPVLDPVVLTMPKGKDGYTPQKGVDYFTDDEVSRAIASIADMVRADMSVPAMVVELELLFDDATGYSIIEGALDTPVLAAGCTYTVTTESDVYDAICRPLSFEPGVLYLGNLGLIEPGLGDTGETFIYMEAANEDMNFHAFLDANGGAKAVIGIRVKDYVDQAVESLATKEYVEQLITGAIGGSY